MATAGGDKLVTIDPDELRFQFEPGKPSHCDLKVSNTTDKNIAFKVKTTSPKKYFVRPNTGIISPWDTCIIRVTLQAQLEYPPDMQCRDKFLLQSTPVPPNSDTDALPANTFSKEAGKVLEEYNMQCRDKFLLQSTPVPPNSDTDALPANTFSKEAGKVLEEYKLKVVYVSRTDQGNSDNNIKPNSDLSSNQAIQTARAARDAAVKEATQLQQELDMLKKKTQKKSPGFSIRLAITAGLIGIMVGLLLKLVLSSPPSTIPPPTPPPTAAVNE